LDNLTKHRKVFGYAETEQKTLKGGYLFFVNQIVLFYSIC